MTTIVPFSGYEDVDEYESLEITIKTVPFQDTRIPIFYISSPSEDYEMTLEELNALMDGVEIAQKNISDIINFLIRPRDE